MQKNKAGDFMLRVLCAAIAAALLVLPVHAQDADQPAPLSDPSDNFFAQLRGGGHVLVMRHGKSPHDQIAAVGMTQGCNLGEGRGLSAEGFAEARSLGVFLAETGVPILKAYTSDMCRAWDTARLVAGGAPTLPHGAQKTTDQKIIAAFKKQIEAELAVNPGVSILLVSHSNIAPLYGAAICEGEDELPEGLISVVDAATWQTIARISANGDVGSCAMID
jgi:phosphohistidine phosphatase SixA